MTPEKSFQNYFLKISGHSKRTGASEDPGRPDTEVIRGLATYRVELKILKVGPSGNKKLRGIFKPTQPPWYLKFLGEGGKGLYVCFKLNSGYGLLEVDKRFCLEYKHLFYKDLFSFSYKEYSTLVELLKIFK